MSRIFLSALLALSACAPTEASIPVSSPGDETKSLSPENNFAAQYGGKTVLYYEDSHGNQIEYYDTRGASYLWYPGNRRVVAGEWRAEGASVCFRPGENTYNPVTREHGRSWHCSSFSDLTGDIVDSVTGDLFNLVSGEIPYNLPAHPKFRALSEVNATP